MIEIHWNWLKLIELDWNWLNLIIIHWNWLKLIEMDWNCFKSNAIFLPSKILYQKKSLGWPIPQVCRKNKLPKKKLYRKTMTDPQAFRFGIPGGWAPNFWDAKILYMPHWCMGGCGLTDEKSHVSQWLRRLLASLGD